MDVCGRVAAIFKILPVLVSFHSSACCEGRKLTTKRKKKNLPTKPALSACPGGWGGGTGLSLLAASLCGACTQPPVKTSFQPSSPPLPPILQSLAFCGLEGFSLFPSLVFLRFTWTMASGERNNSWHPAFPSVLHLQQPNEIENRACCRPSSWVVGLLVLLLRWRCGRHLGFAEDSRKLREEGTSCFQLLSLVRAAAPAAGRQGSLGHCLLMRTVPFLSPSSAKNLTSPTEEKEPFLPAANQGSTDAFLGFGKSPLCLPRSLWCRSHQGFDWRRGGGRPALFSGFSLGFLLLHCVALRLPWWAHTFPLAPSRRRTTSLFWGCRHISTQNTIQPLLPNPNCGASASISLGP